MSLQLSSGNYSPLYGDCDEVSYTTKACIRASTVYFEFEKGFESIEFTLKEESDLLGILAQDEKLKAELNSKSEFIFKPEIDGYVCHNEISKIKLEDIEEC